MSSPLGNDCIDTLCYCDKSAINLFSDPSGVCLRHIPPVYFQVTVGSSEVLYA